VTRSASAINTEGINLMFRKALIATAAAGIMTAGALALTTTAASAHGPGYPGAPGYGVQLGGPGWGLQFGNPPPRVQREAFCRPIVRNVEWWDRFGYPHWTQQVVGQNCPQPHPDFGGRRMNPGWGW